MEWIGNYEKLLARLQGLSLAWVPVFHLDPDEIKRLANADNSELIAYAVTLVLTPPSVPFYRADFEMGINPANRFLELIVHKR